MTKSRPLNERPVHQVLIASKPIAYCDGQIGGDRLIVRALRQRLAENETISYEDFLEAAQAMAARRGISFEIVGDSDV